MFGNWICKFVQKKIQNKKLVRSFFFFVNRNFIPKFVDLDISVTTIPYYTEPVDSADKLLKIKSTYYDEQLCGERPRAFKVRKCLYPDASNGFLNVPDNDSVVIDGEKQLGFQFPDLNVTRLSICGEDGIYLNTYIEELMFHKYGFTLGNFLTIIKCLIFAGKIYKGPTLYQNVDQIKISEKAIYQIYCFLILFMYSNFIINDYIEYGGKLDSYDFYKRLAPEVDKRFMSKRHRLMSIASLCYILAGL